MNLVSIFLELSSPIIHWLYQNSMFVIPSMTNNVMILMKGSIIGIN
jgi:hypothetical protein